MIIPQLPWKSWWNHTVILLNTLIAIFKSGNLFGMELHVILKDTVCFVQASC